MTFSETDEGFDGTRTLASHFSARARLIALGISIWGLGFVVATAPGTSGPLVSIGPDVLFALVLIAASAVALVMLVPGLAVSWVERGASRKLNPQQAIPITLVLCAVALFFGTTLRREVFVGMPDSLRLAADGLLAAGSLLGISAIVAGLGLAEGRTWRRIAVVSLLAVGIGLAANAGLYRNVASSSLSPADFRGWAYLRACEDIGFALWMVFCVGILAWDHPKIASVGTARTIRWIVLGAAAGFAALTLVSLLMILAGVLQLSPPWDTAEDVVGPSHWSLILGRVAWYYLLLYLVPLLASVLRAIPKGWAATETWFVEALPTVPILVMLGLLIQVWVIAYGVWLSRPWWPIWIPCLMSIPVLMLWVRGRAFQTQRARLTIVLAVCLSLIGAGLWLWFRGPSLAYGWSLRPGAAWRVVIRRIIPLTLIAAGLSAIPSFRRIIRTPHPGLGALAGSPPGPWAGWRSIALCPSLVCGVLLFGMMLELVQRIWLRYGTILPFWSSFPPSILLATFIALVGCVFAWRRLVLISGVCL